MVGGTQCSAGPGVTPPSVGGLRGGQQEPASWKPGVPPFALTLSSGEVVKAAPSYTLFLLPLLLPCPPGPGVHGAVSVPSDLLIFIDFTQPICCGWREWSSWPPRPSRGGTGGLGLDGHWGQLASDLQQRPGPGWVAPRTKNRILSAPCIWASGRTGLSLCWGPGRESCARLGRPARERTRTAVMRVARRGAQRAPDPVGSRFSGPRPGQRGGVGWALLPTFWFSSRTESQLGSRRRLLCGGDLGPALSRWTPMDAARASGLILLLRAPRLDLRSSEQPRPGRALPCGPGSRLRPPQTPSHARSAWPLVLSLGYIPLPCPLPFPRGAPLSAAAARG